jgi:cytochrome P450
VNAEHVLPSIADPSSLESPFPAYDTIRAEAPVFRDPQLGIILVTRFEDVFTVLRDVETYSNRWVAKVRGRVSQPASVAAVLAEGYPEGETLVWADGTDHDFHASLLKPFVTPGAVRAMEPALRAMAGALVADLKVGIRLDLVQAISIPMAIQTMCHFAGIPREKSTLFAEAGDAEAALMGAVLTEEEGVEHARVYVELQHYLAGLLEDRESNPGNDLVSFVANALPPHGKAPLTIVEKLSLVKLAVVAGNETTRSLISSCVLKLAQDPSLIERIRADAKVMEGFIEETLRAEPPVMLLFRIATRDVELGGIPIAAGEVLAVCYGSANYDESAFPEPYKFDAARENVRRHLSFGFGVHYCIGAPLARLETRVVLTELLDRFDGIELAGEPPRYQAFYLGRLLKSLSVVLHERDGEQGQWP